MDANKPTIIYDRIEEKIALKDKSYPNGNMANAHAEIGAIQQAFDANKTSGQHMSILVSGRDVCGYCVVDIAAASEKAGLKSLTLDAVREGQQIKYIWLPGMKKIKELK